MSMYPTPDGTTPAYHVKTGEKRHVPQHWLDDKVSPFPGEWRATPSAKADSPPADPPANQPTDPKGK